MLRISWPLALLVAVAIALVARRPQLLVPIAVVFVGWWVWQETKRRR